MQQHSEEEEDEDSFIKADDASEEREGEDSSRDVSAVEQWVERNAFYSRSARSTRTCAELAPPLASSVLGSTVSRFAKEHGGVLLLCAPRDRPKYEVGHSWKKKQRRFSLEQRAAAALFEGCAEPGLGAELAHRRALLPLPSGCTLLKARGTRGFGARPKTWASSSSRPSTASSSSSGEASAPAPQRATASALASPRVTRWWHVARAPFAQQLLRAARHARARAARERRMFPAVLWRVGTAT